uniref:Uncharacterized protein n=1 Tax=Oryza nivara TaxID=4536 RepID=A0A0E0J651_ORYNI
MAMTEEEMPAAKKMKMTKEVLLAYLSREEEDGKKRKKVVRRLGKEVERLLSVTVTVTVPTLSEEAMEEDDEDDEEDVREREMLLRADRTLREAVMSMRKDQDLIRSLFEAKGYVDVLDEVSDDDDDMEMEPLLRMTGWAAGGGLLSFLFHPKEQQRSWRERKRTKWAKKSAPQYRLEVVKPMPDDDEDDVWQKEVLLRANRLLRESAIRMRKNQELIRSLFEAKGYVDVEDEVSDDEMDMDMQLV